MTDWCGLCEKPLKQLSHSAYAECCGGKFYWSTFAPVPRDNLILARKAKGTITGVIVYLYKRIL